MDIRARPDDSGDEDLSIELTRRCEAARNYMFGEMMRLGLTLEAGWRLADKVRHVEGRSEIVIWPIHTSFPSPDGMECVVSVNESGTEIRNTCEVPRPSGRVDS